MKAANLTKMIFGESDRFDEILPHVKIQANDLKGWVQLHIVHVSLHRVGAI